MAAKRRVRALRAGLRAYERRLQLLERSLDRDEECVGWYDATESDRGTPQKARTRRAVVFEAIDRVPKSEYTRGGVPEFDAINERLRKRGYEELVNSEERDIYWRDYMEEYGPTH